MTVDSINRNSRFLKPKGKTQNPKLACSDALQVKTQSRSCKVRCTSLKYKNAIWPIASTSCRNSNREFSRIGHLLPKTESDSETQLQAHYRILPAPIWVQEESSSLRQPARTSRWKAHTTIQTARLTVLDNSTLVRSPWIFQTFLNPIQELRSWRTSVST